METANGKTSSFFKSRAAGNSDGSLPLRYSVSLPAANSADHCLMARIVPKAMTGRCEITVG